MNEPYIVELHLDEKSHLIVCTSDGKWTDAGYMPTHSIEIHVKEN